MTKKSIRKICHNASDTRSWNRSHPRSSDCCRSKQCCHLNKPSPHPSSRTPGIGTPGTREPPSRNPGTRSHNPGTHTPRTRIRTPHTRIQNSAGAAQSNREGEYW